VINRFRWENEECLQRQAFLKFEEGRTFFTEMKSYLIDEMEELVIFGSKGVQSVLSFT
jgi:hypothetical protein